MGGEGVRDYIRRKIRERQVTALWLRAVFCLRCDPEGMLTSEGEDGGFPFCIFCGRDPLEFGPTRRDMYRPGDIVLFDFGIKMPVDRRISGTRPEFVEFDEIIDFEHFEPGHFIKDIPIEQLEGLWKHNGTNKEVRASYGNGGSEEGSTHRNDPERDSRSPD